MCINKEIRKFCKTASVINAFAENKNRVVINKKSFEIIFPLLYKKVNESFGGPFKIGPLLIQEQEKIFIIFIDKEKEDVHQK